MTVGAAREKVVGSVVVIAEGKIQILEKKTYGSIGTAQTAS